MAKSPPLRSPSVVSDPDKKNLDLNSNGEPYNLERGALEQGSHEHASFQPLHRSLKPRHLTMIAIGGIIGPGLFVGSGSALSNAGPGGALLAFIITGFIVFHVMQSLGELATAIPTTGSFTTYAGRFVDPALSYALGWTYWYLWLTVLANEYNVCSLLLQYWPGGAVVPQWGWILLFWFVFLGFSLLGVLAYGEVEFWLCAIKILAILAFFVIAIVIDVGGVGDQGYLGAKYWHDPGAFADGINGVAKIFVVAGTLYAGCESVGVVAGESSNPGKAVPQAIRSVFIRILVFYVGTLFFIGLVIPYNDPNLLHGASRTAKSPFTIAMTRAGIQAGASVMNAIIVVTVISAANSSLNLFGLLSLLTLSKSSSDVFGYLINLSGVSTFITWAIIALCHIRFRQAMKAQGYSLDTLKFKALFYPYGANFALAANVFLIFFQGYTSFLSPFDVVSFVVDYVQLPVFVIMYLGWKFWHKTKFIKAADIDLVSDRRTDEEEQELERTDD